MQLNDIDNLFKRGIAEAENRHEAQLMEAKPRIWEAIEKPRSKKRTHWLLITSMAAAFSMFAIASILFLKLETKQSELEMLQAMVDIHIPSETGKDNIGPFAPKPENVADSETESPPAPPKNLIRVVENNIGNKLEKAVSEKPEPIVPVDTPKTELIAEMDPIITLTKEIDIEPIITEPLSKENSITSRQKKKLKLRIGNGTSGYHEGQNALALNIKL